MYRENRRSDCHTLPEGLKEFSPVVSVSLDQFG